MGVAVRINQFDICYPMGLYCVKRELRGHSEFGLIKPHSCVCFLCWLRHSAEVQFILHQNTSETHHEPRDSQTWPLALDNCSKFWSVAKKLQMSSPNLLPQSIKAQVKVQTVNHILITTVNNYGQTTNRKQRYFGNHFNYKNNWMNTSTICWTDELSWTFNNAMLQCCPLIRFVCFILRAEKIWMHMSL